MNCVACGASLPNGANFCGRCGASVPPEPPSAGEAAPTRRVPRRRRRRALWSALVGIAIGLVITLGIAGYPEVRAKKEARRQFDALVRIGAEKLDKDPSKMLDWQRRLNAILAKVDSDPRVLRAFEKIAADEMGSKSASALGVEPGSAVLVAAAVPAQREQDDIVEQLRAEQGRTIGSRVWGFLVRKASDAIGRVQGRLEGAFQTVLRELVQGEYVRDPDGFENGTNPVWNAYERGNYQDAYRISNPSSSTGCPDGYVFAGNQCAADLHGVWSGRYQGRVTAIANDQTYSCDVKGAVTLNVTQSGSSLSGTFNFEGSYVDLQTCRALRDEQYAFQGAPITGITVDNGVFTLFRSSPNWITGVVHGKGGDIKFNIARSVP